MVKEDYYDMEEDEIDFSGAILISKFPKTIVDTNSFADELLLHQIYKNNMKSG